MTRLQSNIQENTTDVDTQPLISIITVTYNAEGTLARTLDSVRSQSYKNSELILVDGASSDGTVGIVEAYTDVVQKMISERDKGIYDAMNKGISAASGEYLIFLNAGDKLHDQDSLKTLVDIAEAERQCYNRYPDIIYGDTAIVDNEGHFLHLREKRPPETLHADSFKDGMLVCHQAFVIRRELAMPYDLQYRFSSDFDWCIRMMRTVEKNDGRMVLVPGVLIDYLYEGVTTQNHRASLQERFWIMIKHYGLPTTIGKHLGLIWKKLLK